MGGVMDGGMRIEPAATSSTAEPWPTPVTIKVCGMSKPLAFSYHTYRLEC